MPEDQMTPKERWLAVLNREPVDRVPTDYWATEEASAKLRDFLGCATTDEVYEQLHIDKVVDVLGQYVGPELGEDEDEFGCRFRDVDYGTGVYRESIHYPLAEFNSVAEIERNYQWPEPDWWDYSRLNARLHHAGNDAADCTTTPEQIADKADYPIRGGGSEPFNRYCKLRGLEQAFMDLLLNPEMVHYCLDILFELTYQNTRRIYEAIPGQVMISYVAEDFGSQEDLLFSRDQVLEFFIPRMKRMMDLAHEHGVYVFHHSDGAIRKTLPDMIEAGIDVLNPIQWRCKGMDRDGLKRDFGDQVVFHGAMDNQYTLAFGTVDEVRQEVIDNLRILGAGGGYILAPCHNIQAVSPPENIVAMYETAYEYSRTD